MYLQRHGRDTKQIIFEGEPSTVPAGSSWNSTWNAGAAGSTESLHAFMHAKGLPLAVRCDTNPLSVADLQVKTTTGEPVSYRLLSLPLYMVESLPQLLDTVGAG